VLQCVAGVAVGYLSVSKGSFFEIARSHFRSICVL